MFRFEVIPRRQAITIRERLNRLDIVRLSLIIILSFGFGMFAIVVGSVSSCDDETTFMGANVYLLINGASGICGCCFMVGARILRRNKFMINLTILFFDTVKLPTLI